MSPSRDSLSAHEYQDFLLRWQHVHPEARVHGIEGLRRVIAQLQGHENYAVVFERDILPSRVEGYEPRMLDALCSSGEVVWRRFEAKRWRTGTGGFCFADDETWMPPDPADASVVHCAPEGELQEVLGDVRERLVLGHVISWDSVWLASSSRL